MSAVSNLRTALMQLGLQRLLIMGGVAIALLVVIGMVAFKGSQPEMAYLYTDLDPGSAQSITEKLKAQNVPFQISPDGTGVMAPRDRLAELRMSLASDRIGAKIGYEVLDSEEPFGVSASRAKMNETRAIEGELARSIESLNSVRGARVHLVMPERALFTAEARKPTASITLKTQGRLSAESVEAIRYLVSSAVPELSPESVSIIDQNGTLLARAGDSGVLGGASGEERQATVEARMRSELESLLEPIVGQGKVRVEVAVALDLASSREETETFNPDGQVIARQVTVESSDQNDEKPAGGQAGSVGEQLPEAQEQAAGAGKAGRLSAKSESSEDVTYQNSRTQKVVEQAPGKIERLTVAVMLDGGKKGLDAAQLKRLTRLVENAVGADSSRGDSVVVENMTFAAPADVADESGGLPMGITMDMIFSALKLLIISGTGLVALLMLRSRFGQSAGDGDGALPGVLVSRRVPEGPVLQAHPEGADPQSMQMLNGQVGEGEVPRIEQDPLASVRADAGARANVLKQVGEVVAGNPAEATSLIRQWMTT